MNSSHCPDCGTRLESCRVTPCMECGHVPDELDHLREGLHTYQRLRPFADHEISIVLCAICSLEFGQHDPREFGAPAATILGLSTMRVLHEVPSEIHHDKYCPTCQRRLAYLKFIDQAKTAFAGTEEPRWSDV